MFDNDAKIIQRMAPLLQRVLIADPQIANARTLGELMRTTLRSQVWAAPSTDKALRLAHTINPDVIFIEMACEDLDGIAFTQQLRRSDMPCRQAPVIMVTGPAAAGDILAARDAGVHEFLRKPYTLKDLLRRLEAVTLRPREWIEAVDYVGPDRRRFNSGDYRGALKRRADLPLTPDAVRIAQALKILRSAIHGLEKDPRQALRAMQAQSAELQVAATKTGDARLARAALEFRHYLQQVEQARQIDRAELERRAEPLLLNLPREEVAAA